MVLNTDYINTTEIDDFRKTICEKIKAIRISKGMTQGDLADAIGIGRSHISRIESGKFNFALNHLLYIMKVLDIDTIDILKPGQQMLTKKRDNNTTTTPDKNFSILLTDLENNIENNENDKSAYINICADEVFKDLCIRNSDGITGYKQMKDSIKRMAKYKS